MHLSIVWLLLYLILFWDAYVSKIIFTLSTLPPTPIPSSSTSRSHPPSPSCLMSAKSFPEMIFISVVWKHLVVVILDTWRLKKGEKIIDLGNSAFLYALQSIYIYKLWMILYCSYKWWVIKTMKHTYVDLLYDLNLIEYLRFGLIMIAIIG